MRDNRNLLKAVALTTALTAASAIMAVQPALAFHGGGHVGSGHFRGNALGHPGLSGNHFAGRGNYGGRYGRGYYAGRYARGYYGGGWGWGPVGLGVGLAGAAIGAGYDPYYDNAGYYDNPYNYNYGPGYYGPADNGEGYRYAPDGNRFYNDQGW